MSDKLQITIVGLGLLGTSAGLALRQFPEKVRVVGHDRDTQIANKAKALGALDRADWNLINSVSDADRVILALPVGEVRETLKLIGQDLRPGCVILNMSTVTAPVAQWAAELLPAGIHLVSGRPIVVGESDDPSAARADLFRDKLFCLSPDSRVGDTGATLAADLVEALGGRPLFLDPEEHDGLTAGVEHLPLVLAGALLQLTTGVGSWRDMRKLAGNQFYTSTLLAGETPAGAAGAVIANRENVIRWIDSISSTLDEWRRMLEAGDQKPIAAVFERGERTRALWLQAQATGDWEQAPTAEIPTTGDYVRGMLGLRGLDKRIKKGK